jgi:hypothetical protein
MPQNNETRRVSGFTEVALRGYGKLVVEQTTDAQAEGITIEAEPELLSRITTEVRGRRLLLGFGMPWFEWIGFWFTWLLTPDKSIRYRLVVRTVEELLISGAGSVECASLRSDSLRLRISGSGRVRVNDLHAGSLEANISGSGRVECAGSAESVEARISGAGRIDAEMLGARNARARISGSGRIDVNATETLDAWISGAGSVRYKGDPRISTHISGAGRISRVA